MCSSTGWGHTTVWEGSLINILDKIRTIARVIHWRLTWNKFDLHYPVPVPDNPKFMTAWDAAGLIPDGAVIGTSGMAGNQRCAVLYRAIRDRFKQEGHPRNLTVLTVGGQGGRGRVPGTIEELALEGLNTRMITGHTETYKGQLRLAEEKKIDLHCSLLGMMTLIFREQGEGRNYYISDTGAGTFIDPRTARGTPLYSPDGTQYVEVTQDGRFKYSLPPVDTALFNAPAADRKGNIYFKKAAVIGDSFAVAKAAKYNNGRTIVNVGELVEEGYDEPFLPAEYVDAVVYWPKTEQTVAIKYDEYWDCFTPHSTTKLEEGLDRIRLINKILGIMPRRAPVDDILARLATRVFTDHARKGDVVDIGTGLPEEVARLLYESGVMQELRMLTEAGVFGGVATPGIFFGAAVNPDRVVPSCEAFDQIYDRLDWAILGCLQADSQGNVNVSNRGPGIMNYVGPGGFIDLTTAADNILFVSSWGTGAEIKVQGESVKLLEPGEPKFVDEMFEITFNGQEALKRNKNVYYVTHIGAFKLTPRGMELIYVMPGIDPQKEIIDACEMKIVLPESGAPEVVGPDVVTGQGFRFELNE